VAAVIVGEILWALFYAALAVLAVWTVTHIAVADFRRVHDAHRPVRPTQAEIDRECDRLVAELDAWDARIEAMDAASPEDFVSGRWKRRVGYADAAALRWEAAAQADHAARLAAEHPGLYRPPPRPADSVRSARPVPGHEYRLPQWEVRR
jgi:hypothetical protein